MTTNHELRALLAPMVGGGILLPSRVISEVANYVEPEPYADSPAWLIGEMRWSGWQVPVINFALLAGTTDDDRVPDRSRILVVRTLSEASSVVHVGFIINGLPRMKNISTANLAEREGETGDGVFSHVSVDEHPAIIPDLEGLALLVEQAVYKR